MSNTSYPDGNGTNSKCNPELELIERKWLAIQEQMPKKKPLHVLATEHILSGRSHDCIVLIGKKRFPVHIIVLQSYTNFFEEFRCLQVIWLPSNKVTPMAFEVIYKWMIDNTEELPRDYILDIFRAAIFLEIKDLIKFCWGLFDETRLYSESNAAILQAKAKKRGIHILTPILFNRISKFFLSFVATKEFCELCIDEICLLLSLSTVGVNTEVEILMAIIVWLTYDMKIRNVYVNRLLKCVRFYLLPICYLYAFCFGRHPMLIPRILCTPEVKKLALNCFRCLTNPLVNFYKNIFPKQRKWIYDKNCPYHHNEICTYPLQLEYKDFINYLNKLNNDGNKNHWKSIVYKKEMPCQHPLIVSPENRKSNDGLRKKAPYVHIDNVNSDIDMICSESLMELTGSSDTAVVPKKN